MWLWIWLMVVLKIPIVLGGYLVWYAVKSKPEEVIGPAEGGGGISYSQGPRMRGPHGGLAAAAKPNPRRASVGHSEGARTATDHHGQRHL